MTDELDDAGVPISRPVADWLDFFQVDPIDDPRATRWLQAVLRFSRADGSPVFSPPGRSRERLKILEGLASRLGDQSLASVVARWLPPRSKRSLPSAPPPLPSGACPDRPLAILRPDWSAKGDLLAIDHRRTGDASFLEVASKGRCWLGPSWTSSTIEGTPRPARPTHWNSGGFADCSEWSYKIGPRRVTRSVVLLRGRSMALLGQQDDGGGDGHSEIRLGIAQGTEAAIEPGTRSILLSSGRNTPSARLIPLGLPAHDRATDQGSIRVEGREIVIRQAIAGRRAWLQVVLCWGKAPTTWRTLTVAERSRSCRADAAFAARVAWGPSEEGLVIYRSLGPPAPRSFLGHQTSARYLVGAFTRSGEVRPILNVYS